MKEKIMIKKAEGIAKAGPAQHTYELPDKSLIKIVTKNITESGEAGEMAKKTTRFEVARKGEEKIDLYEMDGNGSDEDCLACMGFYFADYDELKEARKIKRLIDLARFIEV